MACQAMVMESKSVLVNDMIENASVLWEFFKGRKLPGVMALDRVCSVNFTIYFLL
jgi:phosphoglycerate kinase